MAIPSVKSLESVFPGKGKIMRRLLISADAVRSHPAAIALERQSYNPQPLHQLRMAALDVEAGTCGVEYIAAGHNVRSPA
ncbi:hypothetical protein, partial [Limosilactobacillus reuteri]|uniref:hypothetical protein n=1 Tax=Limosilactobacillus reuteri TaxID=1598 RepID=UPI00207CCB88